MSRNFWKNLPLMLAIGLSFYLLLVLLAVSIYG